MSHRFSSPSDVMRHALQLAERGRGYVEPNPMVGAVVVDDELNLLGEGWHERFGGPHAEVQAIAAAGERCRGATLFVTLEPCSHHGKTPPCVEAVLAAGFRKVVVAMQDPSPHANGRGIERLRGAGMEVDVGLLEAEARRLVAPFVTLMTRHRPWVHAKWAMTLDGRIASHARHSQWISNEQSRAEVHRVRGRMDAIMVGVETVLADDPLLTARPPGPRTATRIVLDGRGRTPLRSRLCNSVSEAPLLIATTSASPDDWRAALARLGVEVFVTRAGDNGQGVDLPSLLAELGRRQMTNVLVEGGGRVLGSFFDAGLVDECHVFIAPKVVGGEGALAAVWGRGLAEIPEGLTDVEVRTFDGDVYVRGRMRAPLE